MSQQDAEGELGRQPPGELGQESHGIVEGIGGVLGNSLRGNGTRDRPDEPSGEHRRALLGDAQDARQSA
jgi:hypothetical protein